MTWYQSKVLRGGKFGRSIGFPTINLSIQSLAGKVKEGVYACLVRYKNKAYQAVLFYGPRLIKKETHPVLEVYIFEFDQDIYGQIIEFKIISYIRGVKKFGQWQELADQIKKDIARAKKIFLQSI